MLLTVLPLVVSLSLLALLCLLIWIQLFLRLMGKTIKAFLPTLFAALILPVLGMGIGFFWETCPDNAHTSWPLPLNWCIHIAEIAFFSGAVYIGVTLWLHLFEKWLQRK